MLPTTTSAPWRRGLPVALAAAAAITVLPVGPAQAETVNLEVAGLTFPAPVQARMTAGEPGVPAGHAHVVWMVTDPANQHTITFDDPQLVSSGPLSAGQRHEAVIYTAGTVTYRCTIHPGMTGTVVVTPLAAAPAPPSAPPATAPSDPDAGSRGWGAAGPVVVVGGLAFLAVLGWSLLRRRRSAGG